MTDRSYWDFAEEFSAVEAAALIMGIDPLDENKRLLANPVLDRLKNSYKKACIYWYERVAGSFVLCEDEVLSDTAIQSIQMLKIFSRIKTLNPDVPEVERVKLEAWLNEEGDLSNIDSHKFSREGLSKWLTLLGLESEYSFDKKVDKATKEDLSTKERNSLLKLVFGLARGGYSYDPDIKKSSIPTEIVSDLAKFNLTIDVGTVRSYLKQASDIWHDKP
jgi:hypothetical protein